MSPNFKPVAGCEECEALTEMFDEPTACYECVEYGEAEQNVSG